MPFFEVYHIIDLTAEQKSTLAKAFTVAHSRRFTTLEQFVNIRFNNVADEDVYVGGYPRRFNRIFCNVRPGGGRSQEAFQALCHDLAGHWAEIVGTEGDKNLRSVFVVAALAAGIEVGLDFPTAGNDQTWVQDNKDTFKRLADAGDRDFVNVMKELEIRPEFK
ncbi:hypothetical protein B7463_g11195, partial [Scytalidium lignicola]